MVGIAVGFASLLLGVGIGLGALLTAFPSLHTILKVAGAAYLLYHLAWRIAMSRSLGDKGGADTRPMTLLEAAAFPVGQPEGVDDGDRRNGALHELGRPLLSC